MFTSAGASNKKMSWRKVKTSGWAAFGLKQCLEESCELKVDNEPYPPISSSTTHENASQNFLQKNNFPVRSFSSVLVPVVTCSPLEDLENHKSQVVGNSSAAQSCKSTDKTDIIEAYGKLKELHCWADESLIADIMAIVDNDAKKASYLLREIVSCEHNDVNIGESECGTQYYPLYNKHLEVNKGVSLVESTELANLSCIPPDVFNCKNGPTSNSDPCENKNSDEAAAHMKRMLGNSLSIPIEPEWEEDDIYLTNRRNAIRMMRSASRQSKLAADAYLRGDHFSAKQHSMKAKHERMAAEKLNVKAAKEILNIRNSKNGLWKLDLHGLHAMEAVQALQERLQKLESMVELDRSVSSDRMRTGAGILCHASCESFSEEVEKLDEKCSATRQRPKSLHVITGRGSHSRGLAALPTAVRSFLIENEYRYEELRPGAIEVKPKFRGHRSA
ncbi:hypothetical protein NMG60_11006979 [Bertholletia excelsa]